MYISKTDFINYLRCLKYFWLRKHKREKAGKSSEAAKVNIEEGNRVGVLATKHPRYKGGILLDWKGFSGSAEETKKEINSNKFLYEASFMVNYNGFDLFLRSDIIEKKKNVIDIIEVKSSSTLKEQFYWDIAFQLYVIQKAGYMTGETYLMHVDNTYVKKKELNLENFFIIENLSLDVYNKYLPKVEDIINKMIELMNKDREPSRIFGSHCKQPYPCPFKPHCYRNIGEDSVENLSRLSESKRKTFRRLGIKKYHHLEDNLRILNLGANDFKFLTDKQERQLNVYKNQKPYINKKEVKAFLSDIVYPIYYLDFEAYNKTIPPYEEMKVNEFLVFQISLHKEFESGNIKHFEYLEVDGKDPRAEVVKFLIENFNKRGSIIVYNKTFEESRIKDLIKVFPEYAFELKKIIGRLVDLEVPFNKYIYHASFRGRSSIKFVLPAIIPDLSYKDLNIRDGAMAQAVYRSLIENNIELDKREDVIRDLLDYCKMDTWAMVKLLHYIQKIK